MAKPEIDTHDFSATPTASKSFTIPNNTWMIDIVGRGIGISSSSTIDLRLGGISTTTYQRHYQTKSGDDADILNRMSVSEVVGTSGFGFGLRIYAPGLVAPTPFVGEACTIGAAQVQVNAGVQSDATAHTTFSVFSIGGGTLNAGDVWVTYHKRKHDIVETVDFGAAAASSHDFTGINNRSSLVFCSADLGSASSGVPQLSVSTDGVSFDQGATDYKHNRMNIAVNSSGDAGFLHSVNFTSTSNAFLSVVENSRVSAPTSLIWGASIPNADTGPQHHCAYRNSTDKHTAYRVEHSGAANFNSGTLYLLGAK